MAHTHAIVDGDPYFKIDPVTRSIDDQSKVNKVLMQGDHNSERYTFEIDQLIDGHDMSLCDRIEIHYTNTGGGSRAENRGLYLVDDMRVVENPAGNKIVFSWLISSAVTQNVGPLSFLIRFACTENGEVLYAWNTGINKSKQISMSIYNSDAVCADFPDIFAKIQSDIVRIEKELLSRPVYTQDDALLMLAETGAIEPIVDGAGVLLTSNEPNMIYVY